MCNLKPFLSEILTIKMLIRFVWGGWDLLPEYLIHCLPRKSNDFSLNIALFFARKWLFEKFWGGAAALPLPPLPPPPPVRLVRLCMELPTCPNLEEWVLFHSILTYIMNHKFLSFHRKYNGIKKKKSLRFLILLNNIHLPRKVCGYRFIASAEHLFIL